MSELYRNESIVWALAKWHYTKGVRELVSVSRNFLWFVAHFFSFNLFIRTLFAPWKKMGESYDRGLDLGRFASTFIINSLMRTVGFVTRVIVLGVGLVSYVFVLTFSVGVFLIWLFAPALLMGSLILSLTFFVV